ncbi:hypothetical protein BC826DRAFT_62067 [Russula brevipes]|nr:hypothetical protein BC826DRAFT_62067 [Russula brevipes]
MKPEKPENPCLFPDTFHTVPLNTWAAAIQREPLDAQNCLIDWVIHAKAQSSMEHEFLVCARHHSGAQIVLGIDRNAERPPVTPEGATSTASSMSSLGPGTSSSFSSIFSHEAYDRVQVSHDGTPAPILEQHGDSDQLSFITFAQTAAAGSDDDDDADPQRPSLLHLSILLLTIREHFPSYSLFKYQCYFFAHATCLALVDLFGGVETALEERRQATWRGVHVSSLADACKAVLPVLLITAVGVATRAKPTSLKPLYNLARLYGRNAAKNKGDRHQISDEKIRKHEIPHKYRAACFLVV